MVVIKHEMPSNFSNSLGKATEANTKSLRFGGCIFESGKYWTQETTDGDKGQVAESIWEIR